ncbi:MAG: hypothetical protein Q9162_006806 [Coniocarpon cinnabarinum]
MGVVAIGVMIWLSIREHRPRDVYYDYETTKPLAPFPTPCHDIEPLATLPPELLPSQSNDRRLVIIGDLHASLAPLEKLLNATGFDGRRDHVVLTGDTVAKGPEPLAVLARIRDLGATSVRGNHEDKIVRRARELGRFDESQGLELANGGAPWSRNPGANELAEILPREVLVEMRAWPVMLELGGLDLPFSSSSSSSDHKGEKAPRNVKTVVVHGGLMPGLSLQEQELGSVMEMRTLARETLKKHHRQHLSPTNTNTTTTTNTSSITEDPSRAKKGKKKQKEADQWRWVASPDPDSGEKWHTVWNREQDYALHEQSKRSVAHPLRIGRFPTSPNVRHAGAPAMSQSRDESRERSVEHIDDAAAVEELDKRPRHKPYGHAPNSKRENTLQESADHVDDAAAVEDIEKRPRLKPNRHAPNSKRTNALQGVAHQEGQGHRGPGWKKGGKGGEIDEHLEPMRCIYGHDSKLGLVQRKWSLGLDGGCVKGGKLHALVIEGPGKERVVSVDC